MAVVEITKTKLPLNAGAVIPTAVACGADGATVEYDEQDGKIVLIIGTAEATIKAGNGIQGVADLTIPFETGKTKAVVIESGKYVNVSGTHRGKILITGATATVAAYVLP